MKLQNKKTGEMRELKVAVNGDLAITKDDEIISICSSLAELNAEWEDYEEPKEYWYICTSDFPQEVEKVTINEFTDLEAVEFDKQIGNYFETKEEAEKAVEKLKAWKRLKDKGFEFCKYSALAYGEIDFRIPDFESWVDNDEEQVKADLDLLFGGEE